MQDQRYKYVVNENKKAVSDIQKQCLLNCDLDEGARLRQLEKEKLQKLEEDAKPTLEEQSRFREELQHQVETSAVMK